MYLVYKNVYKYSFDFFPSSIYFFVLHTHIFFIEYQDTLKQFLFFCNLLSVVSGCMPPMNSDLQQQNNKIYYFNYLFQ